MKKKLLICVFAFSSYLALSSGKERPIHSFNLISKPQAIESLHVKKFKNDENAPLRYEVEIYEGESIKGVFKESSCAAKHTGKSWSYEFIGINVHCTSDRFGTLEIKIPDAENQEKHANWTKLDGKSVYFGADRLTKKN